MQIQLYFDVEELWRQNSSRLLCHITALTTIEDFPREICITKWRWVGIRLIIGGKKYRYTGDVTLLSSTLSEAIGSLGCRRNSSSGSVLIRQLTELQLMTCSKSVESLKSTVLMQLTQVISSWVTGKSPGSAAFEDLSLPCCHYYPVANSLKGSK